MSALVRRAEYYAKAEWLATRSVCEHADCDTPKEWDEGLCNYHLKECRCTRTSKCGS